MTRDSPTAVLVHLSGAARGTTQRLHGDRITIGPSPTADVRVLPTTNRPVPEWVEGSGEHEGADAVGGRDDTGVFATLMREGDQYRLNVHPDATVWVNGSEVTGLVLDTGDVMEFGRGGPILRYRIYPPGSKAYKSVGEAFSDCTECARRATKAPVRRTAILAAGLPREIATQTSRLFRIGVLALLAFLLTSTVVLTKRSLDLEARLAAELSRVSGLAELADRNRDMPLDEATLAAVRAEVEAGLGDATRRIEGLEARAGFSAEVVEEVMASTLFVQGAYMFRDSVGRPLRHRVTNSGDVIRDPLGAPSLTLAGSGPVFEALYTGTAFVADRASGILATNRHVAVPWEFDAAAMRLVERGLIPEMSRFQAFLPGQPDALPLLFISASEDADVALVRTRGLPDNLPALRLDDTPPRPGEEVIVIGFPLGIRALIARSEPALLEEVFAQDTSFWGVAEGLAARGQVQPLASRGIVGQTTERAVVYDAETTHGGSGGPVIALDGRVVAVNSAIVPEFGGSNLGVPSRRAMELLDRLLPGDSLPPRK